MDSQQNTKEVDEFCQSIVDTTNIDGSAIIQFGGIDGDSVVASIKDQSLAAVAESVDEAIDSLLMAIIHGVTRISIQTHQEYEFTMNDSDDLVVRKAYMH